MPAIIAASAEPTSAGERRGKRAVDCRDRVRHGLGGEPVPHGRVHALIDLLLELLVTDRESQSVQPVQRRDGRQAEAGCDQHHVVQGGLTVDHGPDACGRREQLGGERVGLDLARVRRFSGEGLEGVHLDARVVAAAQMPELVGEREALADRRVRAVDPQHDPRAVVPAASGDGLGQSGDDDGQLELLFDERQEAFQRLLRAEVELRSRLPRPLGARVRVLARHRPPRP